MVIRTATPAEATTLAQFAEHTFREAFAADNRPEDMDAYCTAAFTPEIMRGSLADPAVTTLVMVEDDGALAAYAQLRPGRPDQAGEMVEPLELWRFYVDKVHHGRGIAHRMMDAVIEAARARDAATLWLGVWEHNTRAQTFYRKFGFVAIGSHTFALGADRQTDRIMALSLRSARAKETEHER
jgi:ribosomal protein S18 acetylase RimI-like enzyme